MFEEHWQFINTRLRSSGENWSFSYLRIGKISQSFTLDNTMCLAALNLHMKETSCSMAEHFFLAST